MKSTTHLVLLVAAVAMLRPATADVCDALEPELPGEPQPNPAPHHIMTNAIEPESKFEITLMANAGSGMFKGFLLQARDVTSLKPLGTFEVGADAQAISCGGTANTVTKADDTMKMAVTFTWTAPQPPPETVTITYSVVVDDNTFWVGQQHSMKVSGAPGLPRSSLVLFAGTVLAMLASKIY